nr:anoctamin-4 isoform X2 [Onthophagus taurus]
MSASRKGDFLDEIKQLESDDESVSIQKFQESERSFNSQAPLLNRKRKCNNEKGSKFVSKRGYGELGELQHLSDLKSLSVLSVYQQDDSEIEMDTSRDFSDSIEYVNKPNININGICDNADTSDTKKCCNCSNRNPNEQLLACPVPTIYFNDGIRSVDFVLVWDSFEHDATLENAYVKRRNFEENLMKEGLELEYEPVEHNGLNFVKIHAPKEVLRMYSEILKLRMPMKSVPGLEGIHHRTNFLVGSIKSQWNKIKSWILVDTETFPEKSHRFTAVYSRDREYLFDVDSPCFFTPAVHSRVIQFILDRKRFTNKEDDDFAFGIERLLTDKIYTAAYPLHDGDLNDRGTMRHLLYEEWTSLRKWYKYQPLDYVKEYFGVKIALYFAWLGFYTHMLLPASIVGLACFIYSWLTLYSHQPSEDVCKSDTIIMCPLCDHWCDFWDLKETCVHSRISYLFDNPTTVFFAIFMSFWATLFLELWKRYSAEITHRWDLTGFDIKEEHPRPQYLARLAHVKRKEINVITNTEEPHVPFWRMRVPATILSFSAVLLLVTLAVATVLGVVFYRMSVLTALKFYGDRVTTSNAILFTTSTAACINLCCIVVLNWVYNFLAQYLTELELHRTQTEFDDSLTLKIYLLQFVNYYASIFYIAFFKGKFIGSPKNYNRILGYRQEELKAMAMHCKSFKLLCLIIYVRRVLALIGTVNTLQCGPGGCLLELCIQLAIIMVGKQAMNTALEMLFPLFYKWLNTLKVKTGIKVSQGSQKKARPQWIKDFKLVEWGPRSLFPEYLEMVLQYGFLTIFVAAFPLAPFFALLNNILEMRLDARKLLSFYRRPVTQRVRNIGVWYHILDSIGKLSVVTNGFIIAFTSNFIPRLVYMATVSSDQSLNGYLNFSLSYFNTSDFQVASYPKKSEKNYSICRYPDYRESPEISRNYETTWTFWHILAARLAFVVVFENVVAFVIILVKWLIPDVPKELSEQIRREAFVTNEIIIKQEAIRAKTAQIFAQMENVNTPAPKTTFTEMPSSPEQWDRLIAKSLSGSDWDLLMQDVNTDIKGKLKSPTSV